ncbi:hypothetical protein DUI87_07608 [Hirundo rustica rustica]|uniref:Uncharacterized protein n=1 Tax=Hirundo rustica rustica TaxID=333673 RepID=A0A3M0L869_HIRRU|nr:hypothetical protein DUI87_07608 [Hirundo rustica rustica]
MESGQASGQILPKRGEQQAQLNVTCLPLAKGKKEKDPPTGHQGVLYVMYFQMLYKHDFHVIDDVWCCLLKPYTLLMRPSRIWKSMSCPIRVLSEVKQMSQCPKYAKKPQSAG